MGELHSLGHEDKNEWSMTFWVMWHHMNQHWHYYASLVNGIIVFLHWYNQNELQITFWLHDSIEMQSHENAALMPIP